MDNKTTPVLPEYSYNDTLFDGEPNDTGKEKEASIDSENTKKSDITKPAQALSKMSIVCLITIISIITSIASVFVYDRLFATHIMAVDIKGYLATQRDLYLAGKIDDNQLANSLDKLELFVNTLPKNKKIIMGDVAVRNIDVVKP